MNRDEADKYLGDLAEAAGEPPTTALAWGESPPNGTPKPASPLPWKGWHDKPWWCSQPDEHGLCFTIGSCAADDENYTSAEVADARYIVHACNAYPGLVAERDAARAEVAEHESARLCCVCGGYICPPMTCTGCQLYHGEATAITDHALRLECDRLRAELDTARADLATAVELLREVLDGEVQSARIRARQWLEGRENKNIQK